MAARSLALCPDAVPLSGRQDGAQAFALAPDAILVPHPAGHLRPLPIWRLDPPARLRDVPVTQLAAMLVMRPSLGAVCPSRDYETVAGSGT